METLMGVGRDHIKSVCKLASTLSSGLEFPVCNVHAHVAGCCYSGVARIVGKGAIGYKRMQSACENFDAGSTAY